MLVVQDHHPKEPVDEAVTKADQMQTAVIEATSKLIDAMTDHAKTEEEVESNVKRFDSLR